MKICPNCGAENEKDATFCMSCGFDLTDRAIENNSPDSNVCHKCKAVMPTDAVFCSKCGAKLSDKNEEQAAAGGGKTMFFGAMQEKGKGKLILVRGGGMEGISYNLQSNDHFAGREEGFILFPDDKYCSPKHANFFYFGGKLFVEDQNSLNGVYVRIKSPVELKNGMVFKVGEQLFRADLSAALDDVPELPKAREDVKLFAGATIEVPRLRLRQILEGGHAGMLVLPEKETFTIGREACDLNFPDDTFISGKHARITRSGEKYFLADNGSKNGTFFRIESEQELMHGDYLFMGDQLLRVEIT